MSDIARSTSSVDHDTLKRKMSVLVRQSESLQDSPDTSQCNGENLDHIQIPGFNLEAAYIRLGNDYTLLMQIISDAAPQLKRNIELLKGKLGLQPQNEEILHFELHALAGSCANIGADTLCLAARALEHSVKKGEKDKFLELFTTFDSASQEFVVSLDLLKSTYDELIAKTR